MPLRIRRVTDGAHFRDGRLLLGSRSAGAADEILHFFQGNEAIFVGIHRLEDALVGRLTAAGEDDRICHEYEHMISHLNLLDEGHTQVGDTLILRSYCARTRAVIGSPHQRVSLDMM